MRKVVFGLLGLAASRVPDMVEPSRLMQVLIATEEHTVVLFSGPGEVCPMCTYAEVQFSVAAKEYIDDLEDRTAVRPIIVTMESLHHVEVISQLIDVDSVPEIVLFPKDAPYIRMADTTILFENNGFNKWMDKHMQLPHKVPSTIQIAGIVTLASLAAVVIVGLAFYTARTYHVSLLVAALGIYFLCLSGVVFNMLNNSEWYGQHSDGSIEFINPTRRSQYRGESVFFGLTATLAGVVFATIGQIGRSKRFERSRKDTMILFGVFIFTLLCAFVQIMFSIKYQLPRLLWLVSRKLTQGPIGRDRGIAF